MTSKLTREENVQAVFDLKSGYTLGLADVEILKRVARMALAALDSEPVAYMYDGEDGREYNGHNEFSGGGKGIPLYRHAQPVVPEEMNFSAACNFVQINGMAKEDRVTLAMRVWNACRAAILQAQSDDDGEPTDDERIMAIESIHNCDRCGDEGWVVGEMGITRCACGQAGNSPVIPEGYVMVPKELTCEMDDAAWEAYHNTRCMSDIWDALLSLAPQLPGSEPATVPGKWIPVSERMPDIGAEILYFCQGDGLIDCGIVSSSNFRDRGEAELYVHAEGYDLRFEVDITHWMPLPAAPQEPKP